MQPTFLLLVYCVLVVLASLAGGALPSLIKLTHRRTQLIMSFVGGLMLGVALLHLLPHSVAEQGSVDRAALWTLGGLFTMFLLIRVFHVHAHEHGDTSDLADAHQHDHDHAGPCEHVHAASPSAALPSEEREESGNPYESPQTHPTREHAHDHPHAHHHHGPSAQHPFSWLGLAFGLSLHTLIDGLALGAAVAAEAHEEHGLALFGLGTFLAVALHKPLDALSITSLMAAGGWSRRDIWLANLLFAVMCPLGAIGFVFGLGSLLGEQHLVVGCALAFAAGVFLCISLADLLPEVAFHAHDRVQLTLALILGIGLAYGIGFLEPEHTHEPHGHGQVHHGQVH